MYKAEKWDAVRRILHVRTTPGGDWQAATPQQTIDYLAGQLAWMTEQRDEAIEAARCAIAA